MIRNFYDFRHTFSVRRRSFSLFVSVFDVLTSSFISRVPNVRMVEEMKWIFPSALSPQHTKKDNDKRLQDRNKLIESKIMCKYIDFAKDEERHGRKRKKKNTFFRDYLWSIWQNGSPFGNYAINFRASYILVKIVWNFSIIYSENIYQKLKLYSPISSLNFLTVNCFW